MKRGAFPLSFSLVQFPGGYLKLLFVRKKLHFGESYIGKGWKVVVGYTQERVLEAASCIIWRGRLRRFWGMIRRIGVFHTVIQGIESEDSSHISRPREAKIKVEGGEASTRSS